MHLNPQKIPVPSPHKAHTHAQALTTVCASTHIRSPGIRIRTCFLPHPEENANAWITA